MIEINQKGKKSKKYKWFFSARFYFFCWLTTIALFSLMLLVKQNKTIWNGSELVFFLTNILLGFAFFGAFLLILIWRNKWARYVIGGLFITGIILSVGLLLLARDINRTQATELIECYIDGVPIMATRENCRNLSIKLQPQPQEVRIIQQQPQLQAPQSPLIEPPTKCMTSQDYLSGNLVTRCQKSWF